MKYMSLVLLVSGTNHTMLLHVHMHNTINCTALDSQPALVNLLSLTKSDGTRIRIINTLAPDWRCLAGYLAFDKDGAEIRIIVATHPHNPKACCQEVFQKWLQGRGIRPCTWAKLIEVLDDCEQANLADEIKKAVSGTVTSRHD